MHKSNDKEKLYLALIDPFREAVFALHDHYGSDVENKERPCLKHADILSALREEYPAVEFYGYRFPIENLFSTVSRSDYFNEENKDDTIDMLDKCLKTLRAGNENQRVTSARFVLELFSCAYEQVIKPEYY